jgi:hypothetical protein
MGARFSSHPMSNLTLWYSPKPFYIAISEHGFGVHQIPAVAIRLAQKSVPAKAKPSQLLIYEHLEYIEPVGFKAGEPIWPNNKTKARKKKSKAALEEWQAPLPRLVGLTTTHRGFIQTPR